MLKALIQRLKIGRALSPDLAGKKPVYSCSYPKSGRTWLRFIIANYLNLRYELDVDLDFNSLFTILPNLSTKRGRGLDVYGYGADRRIPLLLSSHARYSTAEFGEGAVLYMLRSIPDVLVSSYFHETRQRRTSRRFDGGIGEFLRDPRGLADYVAYQNSWAAELNGRRSHVLTYEELTENPETTLARVLKFLQVPGDTETIREALRRSSFSTMRETEIERGISGQQYDRADPDARRVRKGRVGGYVDYLGDADLGYIRDGCGRGLSPEAAKLIQENRLLP